MNVLSLFDGISCGQVAFQRAGIEVDKYYAAEIDKYAIQVTQSNWPNTIQLGSVENWREWDIDWSSIDYLIGGSPCQGFSFAGKQLAFDDPRSKLFFVYVDILNHIKSLNPSVKFLLENVKMKKEYLDVISEHLGVEPVFINSALVSAQNRQRYYWCNWEVSQPEDKGTLLEHIVERDFKTGLIKSNGNYLIRNTKSMCLDANYHKGADNHDQRTMILMKARGSNNDGVRAANGKTPSLTSCAWQDNFKLISVCSETPAVETELRDKSKTVRSSGRGSYDRHEWDSIDVKHIRKLTPIECERLQTLPDNYTAAVSNTQRYKALGNGWTVDVIKHILECGK